MRLIKVLFLFWVLHLLSSCNFVFYSKANPISSYPVINKKNASAKIEIDGEEDKTWKKNKNLIQLIYRLEEVTVKDETTFKAVYDKDFLYFCFNVKDSDLYLDDRVKKDERYVLNSDRVEIFLAAANGTYYSFEMDAGGRLFDSKANFGGDINSEWSIPKSALEIALGYDDKGYLLEGKLSMDWLKSNNLVLEDNTLRLGIFRADYNFDGTTAKWLSWKRPDGDVPDFHQESAFGRMRLYKR